MLRKKTITIAVCLIALCIGIVLWIYIPPQDSNILSAVCTVQARSSYAVPCGKNDTVYLSLRDDSLQQICLSADSIQPSKRQSAAFVSNIGHLVTSDNLLEGCPDTLSAALLHQRLLQADTLLTRRSKEAHAEIEELDYYARTHTVQDDGYNEVMAYREKTKQVLRETDTLIVQISKALQAPQTQAVLRSQIVVRSATDTLILSAHLSARHKGLLLLQTDSARLPGGVHRLSPYRWGARTLHRRLLAFNELSGVACSATPVLLTQTEERFEVSEGGVWLNRSGHLCGIERNGERVSSYAVAQLLRKVYPWYVWWHKNATAWFRSLRSSTPAPRKINGAKCERWQTAGSAEYVGQTIISSKNKQKTRSGYGILTCANGDVYEGEWNADTLTYGTFRGGGDFYQGTFDTQLRPSGKGACRSSNGAYYSGEWCEGKRHGSGFSSRKGQMVRCGEWKRDVFKGERMVYTADRIYGIDISRHQHEKGRKKYAINWNALRITSLGSGRNTKGKVDYPVSYIYIKATEGRTVFNKYYPADLRAARKHGIRVGSYHFFSPNSTGASQAAYFLKMAWVAADDLPPVLDLEPTEAQIRKMGGEAAMFNQVLVWLRTVGKRCGKRPILYVNQLFVNNHLKNASAELRSYDVWIARYGEYRPYVRLLHWQLTPYGHVNGIHGDVDINVYNGSTPL